MDNVNGVQLVDNKWALNQRIILALATSMLTAGQAHAGLMPDPISWFFSEKLNFQGIQQVGGIAVGKPFRKGRTVYLPVECNVSGEQKITVEPTTMNSGSAIRHIAKNVEKDAIFLTVVMTVIHGKLTTTPKGPVKLGRIAHGDYKVYYRSPGASDVLLATVSVPAK
jgi:hypothetical protein